MSIRDVLITVIVAFRINQFAIYEQGMTVPNKAVCLSIGEFSILFG
jgi:hypothetical protein